MSKNIWVVLFVSILFGISFGLYEFVLPFYLDAHHVSYQNMGLIFSVSAIAMFTFRIGIGTISDFVGRKSFYSASLLLCAVATFFTPLFPVVSMQILLKTTREASVTVRESMHSLLLFDESKSRFIEFFSKTRGAEFFFQGGGSMLAGVILAAYNTSVALWVSAALLFVAFVAFTFGLRETFNGLEVQRPHIVVKDLLSFDLTPGLLWITLTMFVFTVGLATSHCFVMPLFFSKKFHAPEATVAWIMMIHRLSLGLPMFFAGKFLKSRLKSLWILFVLVEGVVIAVSSVISHFWIATTIWLAHDLIGASIWVPIQTHYMQTLARPDFRGRDVSKSVAYASLGWVVGPWLAGYLMSSIADGSTAISAPFFVSGVLMIVSTLFLIPLHEERMETVSETTT
ncbi:MAG: hypothetical protein HY318_20620 [Armatimonadetes bacterium]|nr:hypothetical protein [Armatimonadota bacterium]